MDPVQFSSVHFIVGNTNALQRYTRVHKSKQTKNTNCFCEIDYGNGL